MFVVREQRTTMACPSAKARARYLSRKVMSKPMDTQVLYRGRWVSREHFCAFVYNSTGEKLAKSYKEFSDLISSGVWFADKSDIPNIPSNSMELEDEKVVPIKRKGGKKCHSPQSR